jgi:electron-transferring-flavoprotein dehydrogenase
LERAKLTTDKFWLLSEKHAFPVPSPFKNQGNFVISLSELVRWLGTKAEELGVEIYPGFAASEVRISSHNQFFPLMLCRQNLCKQGICHVSDTYFCEGAL